MDLRKIYDCPPNDLLIVKLAAYGFKNSATSLTLISMDFLGVRFEVGGRMGEGGKGGKTTPYLKLVRIMLET